MIFELIYTSYPKGLRTGTSGFTSVAHTAGMPSYYIQLCESLSGYEYLFPLGHPLYDRNPVAYSHYRFSVKNKDISILSKIVAFGKDYTGRENKLAHHIVLQDEDRVVCGPARSMMHGGLFVKDWSKDPCLLPAERIRLPNDIPESYHAKHWQEIYGDAGGAGILAQSAIENLNIPSFIVFKPGMMILPLMAESLALIPPEKRWRVTFNTYFSVKPIDSDCHWRCCVADSNCLLTHEKYPTALLIDLTQKSIKGDQQKSKELYECARNNIKPLWATEKEKIILKPQKEHLPSLHESKTAPRPKQYHEKPEPIQSLPLVSVENTSMSRKTKISISAFVLVCLIFVLVIFHVFSPWIDHTNRKDKAKAAPVIMDVKIQNENTVKQQNQKDSKLADEHGAENVSLDLKAALARVHEKKSNGENNHNENMRDGADDTDKDIQPTKEDPQKLQFAYYNSDYRPKIDEDDFNSMKLTIFRKDGSAENYKLREPTDIMLGKEIVSSSSGDPIGEFSTSKLNIRDKSQFSAIYLELPDKNQTELIWLSPLTIKTEMIGFLSNQKNITLNIRSLSREGTEFFGLLKDYQSKLFDRETTKASMVIILGQEKIEIDLNLKEYSLDQELIFTFTNNSKDLIDSKINEINQNYENYQLSLESYNEKIEKLNKISDIDKIKDDNDFKDRTEILRSVAGDDHNIEINKIDESRDRDRLKKIIKTIEHKYIVKKEDIKNDLDNVNKCKEVINSLKDYNLTPKLSSVLENFKVYYGNDKNILFHQ